MGGFNLMLGSYPNPSAPGTMSPDYKAQILKARQRQQLAQLIMQRQPSGNSWGSALAQALGGFVGARGLKQGLATEAEATAGQEAADKAKIASLASAYGMQLPGGGVIDDPGTLQLAAALQAQQHKQTVGEFKPIGAGGSYNPVTNERIEPIVPEGKMTDREKSNAADERARANQQALADRLAASQEAQMDRFTAQQSAREEQQKATRAAKQNEQKTKLLNSPQFNKTRDNIRVSQRLRQSLAELRQLYAEGGKDSWSIGPGGSLVPSEIGGKIDKKIAEIRTMQRSVTRTPGEGSTTDWEGRLALAPVPNRGDFRESTFAAAIDNLDNLAASIEADNIQRIQDINGQFDEPLVDITTLGLGAGGVSGPAATGAGGGVTIGGKTYSAQDLADTMEATGLTLEQIIAELAKQAGVGAAAGRGATGSY